MSVGIEGGWIGGTDFQRGEQEAERGVIFPQQHPREP